MDSEVSRILLEINITMAMIIVEASSLCSPLGTSGSPAMSGILNTVVWVEVGMGRLD